MGALESADTYLQDSHLARLRAPASDISAESSTTGSNNAKMQGRGQAADEFGERIAEANRLGEYLEAFDVADRAAQVFPDDVEFEYQATLALARAGATDQAERRYAAGRLAERSDSLEDGKRVDILALRARLLKDRARQTPKSSRAAAFKAASEAYETIFKETSAPFPGINAASLALLAGDPQHARDLAEQTSSALDREHGMESSYYQFATRAEAALLLGNLDQAEEALKMSAALGDATQRATTLRQLLAVCSATGAGDSILAPLRGASVIHYTGHLFRDGKDESSLKDQIRRQLDRLNVGYGFGSLAAGADILCAEALLERGAALHVVIPFETEEFRRISIIAYGEGWGPRFDRALSLAATVHFATDDTFLGDDVLFSYCAAFAMGLARLQAGLLEASIVQLAVYDRSSEAGSDDVRTWRNSGLETIAVDLERTVSKADYSSLHPEGASPRVLRAMLFGDIAGFSKLRERQLPAFVDHILGSFARVLEKHLSHVESCNTWGDGLYVVLSDARAAAECALALQAAISQMDKASFGLPAEMGLRLGAHFGPVFEVNDPVTGARSCIGSHVSKTARLEPVTPQGAVYVTESFAAEVALRAPQAFRCEYVGRIEAAKHYGRMRMYSLHARGLDEVATAYS